MKISFSEELKKYPLFYRKVWLACAMIPPGSTLTYSQLAKKTGHPRAARAVGQALARNPFAPRIPCHRVIRSDGAPGGYSGRGGIKKKLALLDMERRRAGRR